MWSIGVGCSEVRSRREGGGGWQEATDCRWNCTDGDCRPPPGWQMEDEVKEYTRVEAERGEEEEKRMVMKEVEAEDYYMEMGEEEDLSGEC